MIELLYLLIQLGFQGKYGIEERGQEKLSDIASTIYRLIKDERMVENEKVSLVNLKAKYLKQPLKRVIPPKVTLGISALLFSIMYLITYVIIDSNYQSLLNSFQ